MQKEYILEAATILSQAHHQHQRIEALPERCQPATLSEAHTIQDELTICLTETTAGWKVGAEAEGQIMRGTIHGSRVHDTPASIPAAYAPLLGVEAEIAFVFDTDMPVRDEAYTADEVADAVTAFVAIEIVDSRFTNYPDTPLLHRTADCMSNGGLIRGDIRKDWQQFDLTEIFVTMTIDGEKVISQNGGHPRNNPLIPAIELVNQFRHDIGVKAGQFMTTGTYGGLKFAKPGQTVAVEFKGFGSAAVHFES